MELISRLKRASLSRKKLSPKARIYILKGKSVLFSFVCTFIFLSLPSFLYFFARLHGLEGGKRLAKSKCN